MIDADWFKKLRFDEKHHLGLGDIRLTIAQQEEIVSIIERQRAELETIANLCADLDDYAPVSIEIGMIARKALEEV